MNSKSASSEFCELSAELLDQSMVKIRHCLSQLSHEQVWWRPNPALNSVGNLCVHIVGNLKQWGVIPFTKLTNERDREGEFGKDLDLPITQLLHDLEEAVAISKEIWTNLDCDVLRRKTTIQGFGVTFMHAISHTSSHFVGHTHQIIMLTRIQLGDGYQFQWSVDDDHDQVPI